VVLLEELGADAQASRAREGLRAAVQAFGDHLGALAQQESDGGLGERGHARDARVLLVQALLGQQPLGPPDAVEHVGLALVRAVRAHAQVDLARVGVALERFGHAQDGVWRRHLHIRPVGA